MAEKKKGEDFFHLPPLIADPSSELYSKKRNEEEKAKIPETESKLKKDGKNDEELSEKEKKKRAGASNKIFPEPEKELFHMGITTGVNFFSRKAQWTWKNQKLPDVLKTGKLRTLVVTWNMAGRSPIDNIEPLFKTNSVKHHLYIVSNQECCHSILKSFCCNSKESWKISMGRIFNEEYFNVGFGSSNAMSLAIYIHKSLKKFVKNIRIDYVNCGVLGVFNNKGCIAISFDLGEERFLCIGSHLTSGKKKVKKRNQDVQKIRRFLKVPYLLKKPKEQSSGEQTPSGPKSALEKELGEPKLEKSESGEALKRKDRMLSNKSLISDDESVENNMDITNYQLDEKDKSSNKVKTLLRDNPELRADFVFWAGDLNYRVEMEKEDVQRFARAFRFEKLLAFDQLINQRRKGNVFRGYREKQITFPPSYKYKTYTNAFTQKKRTPSYTDRILVSGLKKEKVDILTYDSATQVVWSDHKPVFAQCEVEVSGLDKNEKFEDDDELVDQPWTPCTLI